jgi:outer membrane protein insertion porin family
MKSKYSSFDIFKNLVIFLVFFIFNQQAVAFDAFIVKNIKVNGLKKVSQEAVLQEVNLSAGEKLTSKKAQQIIKSIYKTNFFSNVQLEKDSDSLIINITERPTIGKLEVRGVKSKDKINKILKDANIAQGLVYVPEAVHKAEKEIQQYYFSQSKYGVEVTTNVQEQTRDRVEVTVNVVEGQEATIKEIKINGNTKFKESVLLKQLFHGKTHLLSWYTKNDRYFKEKLDADLEILQSYYMDRGYVNFQVDSTQVSLTSDQKHVYITINITEGEQYKFGTVHLDGEFVVPREDLQKIIDVNMKKSEVFSRKMLWETKKQIEESLANVGYSKAEVKLNINNVEEQREINIEILINPNKKIMVRKIIISGNYLTQDVVIRRMLPQLEGTCISNSDIEEGKQQILRNAYANNVEVLVHDVPGINDQVDLEYKIEEKKTMELQAGINYSGGEGLGCSAGANIKNFVGTGKDIGFLFEKSKVSTSYKFSYYNPYFNLDGIGFGYDLYFNRNHLSKNSDIADYSTDNLGGNVSWSVPLSIYSSFFYGVGYNYTRLYVPKDSPEEIKELTDKKGFKYREYILNFGWRYNSLDRYIFPTVGLSQRINFKYNLPASQLKYYTIRYESSWYKPLTENKKYIFNLTTDLGYGGKYSNDQYPFFRNFFIGGADSLRGFDERSLGPKDSKGHPIGGNLLINFRTAMIFPVPFKEDLENIRPSIFMDFGQVYNTLKKEKKNNNIKSHKDFRYSAGISVAVHTPLGVPIVLSLAKPLNAKKGDEKKTFSFTFGANY